MTQIDTKPVVEEFSDDPKLFGEQMSAWLCSSPSLNHVILCLHEGTHLLYSRAVNFEPKLYGPSEEEFYIHRIGWRRKLGAVERPSLGILLTADILLIGKYYLGPAYIEERLLGEDNWKEIWDGARFDHAGYHDWLRQRSYIVGDTHDAQGENLVSPAKIRKSVYADFSKPEFRQRLLTASRDYESFLKGLK
jgi:hypothetical protein